MSGVAVIALFSAGACSEGSIARGPVLQQPDADAAGYADVAATHDRDATLSSTSDGASDAHPDGGTPFDASTQPGAGDAGDDGGTDGAVPSQEDAGAPDAEPGGYYPNAENRSGDRLKVHVLEASDGVRVANGWSDNVLGTPCRFAAASDGLIRCVPAGEHVAIATSYFVDSDCTKIIGTVPYESCAPPRWIQAHDSSTCPPRVGFYEVGPRVVSEAAFRFDSATQACVSTSLQLAGAVYYEAGAFVDPTHFETGQTNLDTTMGAVSVREIVTDDGAHAFLGFVDSSSNANCLFLRAFDGVARCLPEARAWVQSDRFSDAQCGHPVASEASATASVCSSPRFASERMIVDCVSHFRFYETGPAIEATYAKDGEASCIESAPTLGQSNFELGPVIQDNAFVEVTSEKLDLGLPSQRLFPWVFKMLGRSFRGSSGQVFDAVRNESCTFSTASDGKPRCLPYSSASEYFYRDPACTEPVLSVTSFEGCDRAEAPTIARVYDRTRCPYRVRILAVGPEVQLDPVYLLFDDGRCLSTSQPSARFYLEGDEIAPDAFVEAEDVEAL